MKKYPAIAFLEINNIASGLRCVDIMLKQSPISVLRSGTVSSGKFLIYIGGSVAAVDEAFTRGMDFAGSDCLDAIQLPDVDADVVAKTTGAISETTADTLGIVETNSIASILGAADRAVKGADVSLLEIRMGDSYGGKAYVLYNGKLEDVEAAIDISCSWLSEQNQLACSEIISNMHHSTIAQVDGERIFRDNSQSQLPDGE